MDTGHTVFRPESSGISTRTVAKSPRLKGHFSNAIDTVFDFGTPDKDVAHNASFELGAKIIPGLEAFGKRLTSLYPVNINHFTLSKRLRF